MSGIEVLAVGEGTTTHPGKGVNEIVVKGEGEALSLVIGRRGATEEKVLRRCAVGVRHKDEKKHTIAVTFEGVGDVKIGCNGTEATFAVDLFGALGCKVSVARAGHPTREEEVANGGVVTVTHDAPAQRVKVVRVAFSLGEVREGAWSVVMTHAPHTVTVTSAARGAPAAGTAALKVRASGLADLTVEGAEFHEG